jgi:ribosome recycling factor
MIDDVSRHQWPKRHAVDQVRNDHKVRGEAMAPIDTIKHIKFNELTAQARRDLKKTFREHARRLRAAIRTVDRGLKALAKKQKAKRTAKRRTARR